jgi:hypothetical protein
MPQAKVTIDYVNQPNKNPKYGSIKTQELGYVSVAKEALGQFMQNEVCTISYATNPKGYHNLVQKMAHVPRPAANGPIAGVAAAMTEVRAADVNRNRHIFVCGAVNSTLSNPSINPLEMTQSERAQLTASWMGVYDMTLGRPQTAAAPKPKPKEEEESLADQMDDEIPY